MVLSLAHAQQKVKVMLTDYSIYKGPVLKTIDSLGIYLDIEGSTVIIPHRKVHKIKYYHRDRVHSRDMVTSKQPYDFTPVEKGYYHTVGVGVTFSNHDPGISLGIVNGYQWGPYVGTGLGIGYERFEDIGTVPFYLEVKGYVKKGRYAPYYFIRPGYGLLSDTDAPHENLTKEGGIYWQAGVGYQITMQETALALSLAHVGQNASIHYSYSDWWNGEPVYVTEKSMKRRIAFRIEFIF